MSDPSPINGKNLGVQVFWAPGYGKCQLRYFLGGTHTASRNFFFQGKPLLLRKAAVHVCVDDAAGDGIDCNMAGGQFLAQGPGKGIDAALAGGIGHFAGSAHAAPYRGNVDDTAGFG